jgi:hypothetical protein
MSKMFVRCDKISVRSQSFAERCAVLCQLLGIETVAESVPFAELGERVVTATASETRCCSK